MIYETFKSLLKKYVDPIPSTFHLLIAGGIAGTAAQTGFTIS
jgi:hypothetical protein